METTGSWNDDSEKNIPTKIILRFNKISSFLNNKDDSPLKKCSYGQIKENSQNILKIGDIYTGIIKICYKNIIVKLMWYSYKNKEIDQ